jgi:hypothetical protein
VFLGKSKLEIFFSQSFSVGKQSPFEFCVGCLNCTFVCGVDKQENSVENSYRVDVLFIGKKLP